MKRVRGPTDWNCDTVFWDTDGVIRIGGSSGRVAQQDIDSDDFLPSPNWSRCGTGSYEEKCQNGRESDHIHCIKARDFVIWYCNGGLLLYPGAGNEALIKESVRPEVRVAVDPTSDLPAPC